MRKSNRSSIFLLLISIIPLTLGNPLQDPPNRHRQEEDDDDDGDTAVATPGPNFGPQVAQIITGAFTGDLSSILHGSFGLVPEANVQKQVNKTYETIFGITDPPTTLPPTPAPSVVLVPVSSASGSNSSSPLSSVPVVAVAAVPQSPAPVAPVQQVPVVAVASPSTTSPPSEGGSGDDEDESDTQGGPEGIDVSNYVFNRSKVLYVF